MTHDYPGWYPLMWSGGITSYGTSNSNNIFENNEVSYAGIRDDGYEPDPTNKGFGIWLDTVTTTAGNENIVRYNKVHDNAASGLFSEKDKYSKWYYNISYNNAEYGLRVGTDENDKKVQNNVYYNNTLYGNSTNLWVVGVGGSTDVIKDNTFKNNLTDGATTREFTARVGGENDGSIGSGNVYEYNSFGAEYSNFIEWGAGVYKSTYAAFDTAYGSSTHSVAGDPYFVGGGDAKPYPYYYPRSYSPVINAGTDVGLTSDYLGTSVPQGAAPDIGAFEYTVSIPENIWFFFPLFLALPRLIFILQNKKGRQYFFSLLKIHRYKAIVLELYSPYLNLFSQLTKRADK